MRYRIASRIMRTTIDLDPGVLRDLKARARREGKSLGRVASELLAGQRAFPERLLSGGFEFRHPVLEGALRAALER